MGHPYQPMSHSPEDGMEKGGWGGGCAVIFICQDHCTHKLTTATVTCAVGIAIPVLKPCLPTLKQQLPILKLWLPIL